MPTLTMRDILRWRDEPGGLTAARWARLQASDRARIEVEAFTWLRRDTQANQLLYYRPVNPDARRVHLSTAREVGIQGGNKTLIGGSRVVTGRGIIPIEEVKVGDEIVGAGYGGTRQRGEVVELHESSVVPVFRLRTKRGYELTGTAGHPVWVARASEAEGAWHHAVYATGRGAETRFQDIRPDDFVRVKFDGDPFPAAGEITPEDAYFLGLMTADGSWYPASASRSEFTKSDDALVDWLVAYLAQWDVTARQRRSTSSPITWQVSWYHRAFKATVASWGVTFAGSTNKTVPESIWRGTRAVIIAFLQGYGDGDGCVTTKPSVVWTSASERLLREVQLLLLRFGIMSSRRRNKDNGPFRSWRLEITGRNAGWYAERVGFRLARRVERLARIRSPKTPAGRWDRIVALESVGKARVYPLTVSPHHRYLADGFINGNSGKTGVILAEAAIAMTGLVPESLAADYPRAKRRGGPIAARLVVTSLVSAWDTNLKHKLQYFHWNGKLNADGLPGDPRLGHWGWIPQAWLINGDWEQSWDDKHRILRLQHPQTREPWSTLHIMSHDQSLEDFNQGAFHWIGEDEIPPEEIHRANRIRAMELGGQIFTGGTPPDDRSASVTAAWFFDQIIVPGLERSDPEAVDAVVLWTEHNRTLDERDVAHVARGLSPEQRRARLHGDAIHLAGVVLKGFTEKARTWCFRCEAPVYRRDEACETCGGRDLVGYSHVWDDADLAWPGPPTWPVLFYMDPHQARPTACAWFKIDPNDGWWQIAEAEVAGNASAVKRECLGFEAEHELDVLWRKGDPKITTQTNQFAHAFEGREFTIREAFQEVGFDFEDANTNFTVALERIEQALQPSALTRAPRLRVHRSCARTLYQAMHFVWNTRGRSENVDTKEQPSRRHSDFPALLRYLAMDDPDWRTLQMLRRHETIKIGAGAVGRSKATGW